jgi:Holliday junction resolvase RusA-like endonuclease
MVKPKVAPRPRVHRFGTYNDPKYTEHKDLIRGLTKIDKMFEGAIKIDMTFQIVVPKSWTKKKKSNYKNIIPIGDCDNYAKTIMDALQKHAFEDDRQVVELRVRKRYGLSDMIIVRINEVNFDIIEEMKR